MEEKKDEKVQSWWQPGVVLFVKTSGWIGVPIVVALFVGRWLDRRYDTDPWLFLVTIGFAFLISSFGIMMESIKVMKNIDKEGEREKHHSKKDPLTPSLTCYTRSGFAWDNKKRKKKRDNNRGK